MLVPLSNPASYNMGIYKAKQLDNGEVKEKIDYQQRLADYHSTLPTKIQLECANAMLNRQNPASYNMGIYVAKQLNKGELARKID